MKVYNHHPLIYFIINLLNSKKIKKKKQIKKNGNGKLK